MSDCIFCKIADGSVPCMRVYEDEHTLAFMDIAKDVDGHILVIPKAHSKNIPDCDENTLLNLMKAVKKISRLLADGCGYTGINLLNANGESAGQSVPHFHIHIIPRRKGDNINAWPSFNGADKKVEEVYEEIVGAVSHLL